MLLSWVGHVLETFFDAMQNGYAHSVKKGAIAELSGSKTIPYEAGSFKVLDCYLVVPDSPHSFGQTVIWYNDIPVWVMSYQGWFRGSAIPFLKHALREMYSKRIFLGGRGPHFLKSNNTGMVYVNNVEPPNDWKHFRGREEIFSSNGDSLGWHEYQGLLLLPHDIP